MIFTVFIICSPCSNGEGMALMVGATAVTPATERRTESGGDSEARHQVLQIIGVQWVVMMWKFYRLVMLSYVQ